MSDPSVARVEWTAVVDRLEGEWAVLLVGEGGVQVEIPRSLLPPETAEGDHLRVGWERDREARAQALERIRRLREELGMEKGDFDL